MLGSCCWGSVSRAVLGNVKLVGKPMLCQPLAGSPQRLVISAGSLSQCAKSVVRAKTAARTDSSFTSRQLLQALGLSPFVPKETVALPARSHSRLTMETGTAVKDPLIKEQIANTSLNSLPQTKSPLLHSTPPGTPVPQKEYARRPRTPRPSGGLALAEAEVAAENLPKPAAEEGKTALPRTAGRSIDKNRSAVAGAAEVSPQPAAPLVEKVNGRARGAQTKAQPRAPLPEALPAGPSTKGVTAEAQAAVEGTEVAAGRKVATSRKKAGAGKKATAKEELEQGAAGQQDAVLPDEKPKGRSRAAKAKVQPAPVLPDCVTPDPEPPAKKARGRKKPAMPALVDAELAVDAAPTKRRRSSKKLVTTEEVVVAWTVAEEDEEGTTKRTRRKRTKVVAVEDAEPEQPKKVRTRVRVSNRASAKKGALKQEEEEVVEQTIVKEVLPVIPFEQSQRVRLGYACLNSELRAQKPPVFCSRTMILKKLAELGSGEAMSRASQNLEDLKTVMHWNEARGIRFFRISSGLFPHLENPLVLEKDRYDLSFALPVLREIGDLAKKLGHRLSFHPSHFNQLASTGKVYAGTLGDLGMHASILDAMGCDQDSVLIVHGGGAYGDKEAAKVRVVENVKKMPENIRKRLVFENDERIYTTMDLLPMSEELQVPICVDYFHHQCYGEELFDIYDPELTARIHKVWQNRGMKPKCHFSEQSPGDRVGAHSKDIAQLPEKLLQVVRQYNMDIMLESKDKESSLKHMHDKYFRKGIDGDRITWVLK